MGSHSRDFARDERDQAPVATPGGGGNGSGPSAITLAVSVAAGGGGSGSGPSAITLALRLIAGGGGSGSGPSATIRFEGALQIAAGATAA